MLHRYSVFDAIEINKRHGRCSILGNGDGDLDMAHRLVAHHLKQHPKVNAQQNILYSRLMRELILTDVNRTAEARGLN